MSLVPYNGSQIDSDYNQSYDNSNASIPIYSGSVYQRGHGLGNILSGFMKVAMPIVKKGAISLGKTALKTGLNIAKDSASGTNFRSAISNNMKAAGHELFDKTINHITKSSNKKRKRKRNTITSKPTSKRKRTVARDIFTK